jgi:hypothetical protein
MSVKPGELHVHRCGYEPSLMFDADTGLHKYLAGCGATFVHRAPTVRVSEEDYNLAHMCAGCGRGPWLVTYDEKSWRFWQGLSPKERVEAIAKLHAADVVRDLFMLLVKETIDLRAELLDLNSIQIDEKEEKI